ncbi:MAG TPA: AAA domain-containing protein [Herpetosiphonaceae bacterium]
MRHYQFGQPVVTSPVPQSDPEVPIPPSDPESRRATVDKARALWIKKLIDLSRRNNLLYFRDLKAGTLDLSAAEPQAFAALLDGETVSLARLLPARTDETRHYARFLPALMDDIRQYARIHEIQQRALLNLEEKGIETLFLALGMATWQPGDDGRPPASAVLLVPISITIRGRDRREALLKRSGEVQVNLVLLHVLETEFGCLMSPEYILENTLSEDESFDQEAAYARLASAAQAIPGFAITPRAVLGNFSFQKMAIVKDLRERAAELANHDIIAALAGDLYARHIVHTRRARIDPLTLDQALPEQDFFILDADSSQQQVLRAVLDGQDGVIQGPPGTGKSQTIANLIAALAAQGKRVLFVAEKRAALEVVYRRLHSAGLGHLALDLHGADISRREVMRRFAESLTLVRDSAPVDATELHQKFAERRARLNGHVYRLHKARQPSGLSFFDLQGRLLRLPAGPRSATRWRGSALQTLNATNAAAIRDLLIEAGSFERLFLRNDPSPWTGAMLPSGTDVQRAIDLVVGIANERWPSLHAAIAEIVSATGLHEPTIIDDTTSLLVLLNEVSDTLTRYTDEVFTQDLAALLEAFAPASKGSLAAAWAWCSKRAYRDARRALRALRKEPAPAAQLYTEVAAAHDQLNRWRTRSAATAAPCAVQHLDAAQRSLDALIADVHELAGLLRRPEIRDYSFTNLVSLIDDLGKDLETPYRIPRLLEIERGIQSRNAQELVDELRRMKPRPEHWPLLFDHVWLTSCLDAARAEETTLAGFSGRVHDQFVREFCELDRQRLRVAAKRVHRTHAERAVKIMNTYPEQAALVRREAEKKRRHLPLRTLVAQAPNVLTALRPCWMASPLSVSQLLDAGQTYFDVVIFDEASQVLPEDAVAALLRGAKVVVAGDKHQLPPTTFFAAGENEEEEAEYAGATEGFESLLDLMASFFEPWPLEWHYRSRDEALIAFANHHIYNNGLVTFPSPNDTPVVSHVLVPHTDVQTGDDSTDEEVRRVVDLVIDHARVRPRETLGVITMGIRHAQRIKAALDEALRVLPQLDPFFDQQHDERFFVKNLERVQGDERDAIILSIGYGKDQSGRLLYRFGPLLMQGGERRLNVAITRARQRMTVVSSFAYQDMEPNRSRARGVEMLRQYLQYITAQGPKIGDASAPNVALSLFEADLFDTLTARGVPLVPRVGASRYRIDFAAQHPTQRDRLVLALECDGPTYQAIPTARDRDRLRQAHLESLDWKYLRIWSIDWFMHRDEEVARILKAFQAAVQWVDPQQIVSEAAAPAPTPNAVVVAEDTQQTPAPSRGPRPNIGSWTTITDYTEEELVALVKWIQSDGRLRTDDEVAEEMVQELGFRRRGPRIMSTIRKAIARARLA